MARLLCSIIKEISSNKTCSRSNKLISFYLKIILMLCIINNQYLIRLTEFFQAMCSSVCCSMLPRPVDIAAILCYNKLDAKMSGEVVQRDALGKRLDTLHIGEA